MYSTKCHTHSLSLNFEVIPIQQKETYPVAFSGIFEHVHKLLMLHPTDHKMEHKHRGA